MNQALKLWFTAFCLILVSAASVSAQTTVESPNTTAPNQSLGIRKCRNVVITQWFWTLLFDGCFNSLILLDIDDHIDHVRFPVTVMKQKPYIETRFIVRWTDIGWIFHILPLETSVGLCQILKNFHWYPTYLVPKLFVFFFFSIPSKQFWVLWRLQDSFIYHSSIPEGEIPDEVCGLLSVIQEVFLPILEYLNDPISLVEVFLANGNCAGGGLLVYYFT